VVATVLAVVIAFLIITYLHVVIGELVPKAVALRYPERIALGVSTAVRGLRSGLPADLGFSRVRPR